MAGTPSENERLAREHFLGLFNREDPDREAQTEGFRIHANSHDPRTVDQQLRAIETYRAAIPDLTVAIEDAFATADRATLRATVSGTHQGEFDGVAPTGATIEIPATAIYRIADGGLAEAWYLADTAGLQQQIRAAADADR